MKKIILLVCILAAPLLAQQSATPITPGSLPGVNTCLPLYLRADSGIPIFAPSKACDNGSSLIYNGIPLGIAFAGQAIAGSNFPNDCAAAATAKQTLLVGNTYNSLPAATYSCSLKAYPGASVGGTGVVLAGPIEAPDAPWLSTGVTITGKGAIKTIWFGNTDWAASLTAADAACGLTNGCDINMVDGWGAAPAASSTLATITKNDHLYLGALTFPCGNAAGCVSTTADHITVSGANSGNPAASGASFIPAARFLATVPMTSMWLWGSHTGNGSGILERFMVDGGTNTVCAGTATLANSSATLNCSTNAWTAGDVGKVLQVSQGGTRFTPTITAFVSPTQVTLNTAWTGTAFTTATVTQPYANNGIQLGTTTTPLFLGETIDHVAGRNLGSWIAVEASVGNPAQNLTINEPNCGDNTAATNPVATCLDASIGPVFVINVTGGRMLAADIPLKLGPDSATTTSNTGESFDVRGTDIETVGSGARHLALFGNVTGARIHDCYMEASATNTQTDLASWGGPGGGSPYRTSIDNCKLVNDGRTTYGFSWLNGTLFPAATYNTLIITGDTDFVHDAATNSFGLLQWNATHASTNLIDNAAHLQQVCNSTGSAFRCTFGGYLDTGNQAQVWDFFASSDSFNVMSIRSGFNSQPYTLSFGTNQSSGYTEIQSWRSEIGFDAPLWLQRQGGTIRVGTNCSSAASPAVCSVALAGSVAVAAAGTSLVVQTTAVTANSQIFLQEDASLGTKLGVTCNTTPATAPPVVTARTAGTSFTFSTTAPITNPRCFSYSILN